MSAPEPPKLLLDTNVYLDLADGHLRAEGERLKAIAAHRDPPLLWSCQITFDELAGRICEGDLAHFLRYRAALRWVDDLCSILGMAESLKWVLRCGTFANPGPKDGDLAPTLNACRRALLRAGNCGQVAPEVRAEIQALQANIRERVDAWVVWWTKLSKAAQKKVQPGERGLRDTFIAANALLTVSRGHLEAEIPLWGPLRDEEDQKRVQRELIAFKVALLRKSQNRAGYNHEKYRGDYHDYWLLAYPAAGYTIVTRETRLPNALKQAECADARIVSLEDGIAMAEGWLSAQR